MASENKLFLVETLKPASEVVRPSVLLLPNTTGTAQNAAVNKRFFFPVKTV